MERLHGHTLSAQLQGRSRLSSAELTELISAVCCGIEAAHAAGIIHRDLKPSNLFLHQREGKSTWKILDFGVSKFMDDGDTITAGAIVGTPAYMSPEQAKSGELSPQTDLYALGVITYRALTGRPAFSGKDLPAVLHSVVYDMPPKPSTIAELSPNYDALLAIAMAKDPGDRFANAAELAEAFVSAAGNELSAALRLRGETQMRKAPWGQRGGS
jgi:serine/threonine-protein kinase